MVREKDIKWRNHSPEVIDFHSLMVADHDMIRLSYQVGMRVETFQISMESAQEIGFINFEKLRPFIKHSKKD